jgi:hypothetical protein
MRLYKDTHHSNSSLQLSLLLCLSLQLLSTYLAQGNSGAEIYSILDAVIVDIEENIDDVEEYYAAILDNNCVPSG